MPETPGNRAAARWLPVTRGLAIATVLATEASLAGGRLEAQGHSPTFARDVAPILYRNCTTCHRPGGHGPMSLLTYADARAAAPDIADMVGAGLMPPWHADAPRGKFVNDRRLTDAEKAIIVKWTETGTPAGDMKDMPPVPVYTSDWVLGTPDVVLGMSEEFAVPAAGTIEYQYFEVPTNFTEDKWVKAIEIRPGAREVVHHVLVFARPPEPAATPTAATPSLPPVLVRRPDHRRPDPPPGAQSTAQPQRGPGALIASTAPGTNVVTFPEGTALRVRAGTVLTFQMHYTAHGHPMKDRTSVGMVFSNEAPAEQMLANSFQNDQFTIPAGAADHAVPAEIGFRDTVRVWGILPHTHVRGKRWEYRLVMPDGRTETILSVPRYDFSWQTYYMFAKPLEIPPGGKIESMAWYDNSAANPSNPDPTKDVRWGDQTWEEMQYTGFLYTVNSRRLTKPPPP